MLRFLQASKNACQNPIFILTFPSILSREIKDYFDLESTEEDNAVPLLIHLARIIHRIILGWLVTSG
ncbi:MAG: hypothetical protein PHF99_03185 [Bacteroidales bacterium]|nr:hypothetical protein [Bacteroidales bacterium]